MRTFLDELAMVTEKEVAELQAAFDAFEKQMQQDGILVFETAYKDLIAKFEIVKKKIAAL